MRKLGYGALGLVMGAGLAGLLAWPRDGLAGGADPQGMRLLGLLFLVLPLGAVAGLVAGLVLERLLRR